MNDLIHLIIFSHSLPKNREMIDTFLSAVCSPSSPPPPNRFHSSFLNLLRHYVPDPPSPRACSSFSSSSFFPSFPSFSSSCCSSLLSFSSVCCLSLHFQEVEVPFGKIFNDSPQHKKVRDILQNYMNCLQKIEIEVYYFIVLLWIIILILFYIYSHFLLFFLLFLLFLLIL